MMIKMLQSSAKTFLITFVLFGVVSCKKDKEIPQEKPKQEVKISAKSDTAKSVSDSAKVVEKAVAKEDFSSFIPKGFVLFEKSFGDLNKDGLQDAILIIKDTKKENFVYDEHRGELDRNRRGIIILFKNKNNGYDLATKNLSCFSSENEEGGNYYAPELVVDAEKGSLIVHYAHGRYGYWRYQFRHKNNDFEMIGFERSEGGSVISSETSINFLTRKKLYRENINENTESGDEVLEETWTTLKPRNLLKLSEIKDFDELDFYELK